MSYLICDLETSVNNVGEGSIGNKNAPAPWHPDNNIVMYMAIVGYMRKGHKIIIISDNGR